MPVVDSWPLFCLNADFFAMSLDCDSGTRIVTAVQIYWGYIISDVCRYLAMFYKTLLKGLRTPTCIPRDVLFECLFVKYSYNRFSNRKSALCKESIVLINIFKHDQILFTCLVESEENVAAEVSVSAVVRDRGVRRICVARSQVSCEELRFVRESRCAIKVTM